MSDPERDQEARGREVAKKRKPPKFDWAAIERDWRAGVLTNADIARKYGMLEQNLRRKAKAGGWQKDLKETIRSRSLIVLRELEQDRDHERSHSQGASSSNERADDREEQKTEDIINDAVQSQLGVILDSRKRITKATDLVDRLMSELDGQTENREALEALIEMVYAGADPSSVANRQALKRALSLNSRVVSMVNLATAIGKLTQLRRQAFGLEEKSVKDPVLLDAEKAQAMDGRSDRDRAAAVLNMIERAARAKATNQGPETKQ